MAATPTYAAYDYTACGAQIRSQSIVECRLSDWAQNRPLAVCPSVTLTDAEVRDGEIRYGGKLYFSVVARAEDGAVISAERGAEFSHKAECADHRYGGDPSARSQTAHLSFGRGGRGL